MKPRKTLTVAERKAKAKRLRDQADKAGREREQAHKEKR